MVNKDKTNYSLGLGRIESTETGTIKGYYFVTTLIQEIIPF